MFMQNLKISIIHAGNVYTQIAIVKLTHGLEKTGSV
jgi:hypothetical protein